MIQQKDNVWTTDWLYSEVSFASLSVHAGPWFQLTYLWHKFVGNCTSQCPTFLYSHAWFLQHLWLLSGTIAASCVPKCFRSDLNQGLLDGHCFVFPAICIGSLFCCSHPSFSYKTVQLVEGSLEECQHTLPLLELFKNKKNAERRGPHWPHSTPHMKFGAMLWTLKDCCFGQCFVRSKTAVLGNALDAQRLLFCSVLSISWWSWIQPNWAFICEKTTTFF